VVDVKFGSGQAVAALILLLDDDFGLLMVYKGQLAAVHGGLDVLHHLRPQADFLCVVVDDIAKGALGFSDLVGALWDVVGLGGVQPLQLPGQVAALVEVHIELHARFQAGEVECTRADAVAVFIHLFDDVRGVITSGRVFPRAAAHQIGAGLILVDVGVQGSFVGLLGTSVAVRGLGFFDPEGFGGAGAAPNHFCHTIAVGICGKLCDRDSGAAFAVINRKCCSSQRLPILVHFLDLQPCLFVRIFRVLLKNRHNNRLGLVGGIVNIDVHDLVRELLQGGFPAVARRYDFFQELHISLDIRRVYLVVIVWDIHVVVGPQIGLGDQSQL